MGANPHANGGLLLRDLTLPDFRDYAVDVPAPGASTCRGHPGPAPVRDVIRDNPANFRVFGPDETASNRLAKLRGDRPQFDRRILPGIIIWRRPAG